MTKHPKLMKARKAITIIKSAIDVRSDISTLYSKYRELSSLACQAANLNHHDLKRAVDALYYLGGGWPHENSKGRMEGLLDNFSGMYKILDFIGSGYLVEEHLAKYGITVKISSEFKIDNAELEANERRYLEKAYHSETFNATEFKDVRDLVTAVVLECQEFQRDICKLADKIKDELRPAAMNELGIEDQEYERLYDITKTSVKGTPKAELSVGSKKIKIQESICHFNTGLSVLKS